MFHLGAFESSLRNSDGGKKYAARKWKESKNKCSELQLTHRSCVGKAHGDGILKNKIKDAKKKKKEDQCVPISNESLTDSAVEVDHKVPSSSQEASVDGSIGLSESDNEKLKSTICDNYLIMKEALNCNGGDNSIASANVFEPWSRLTKNQSWEMMKPKTLKIRGPFGSLVDLSKPSDRSPFRSPERNVCEKRVKIPVESVMGREIENPKISLGENCIETKDNQSEEKLLEAIKTLVKQKEDEESSSDIFDDLDVERFENEKVSKLFETYYNDLQTKDKFDSEENIDSLLDSLVDLGSDKGRKKKRTQKSFPKVKKKNLEDVGRLRKPSSKDEEIVKQILPMAKLEPKSKKNAQSERRWIPGGILKRSVFASDTADNIRLCAGKNINNQKSFALISKSDIVTQKLLSERTVPIKSVVSGKSEMPEKQKCVQIKPEKDVGNVELISALEKDKDTDSFTYSEKSSRLSKQITETLAAKRKPSKNEILAKSNEAARKLYPKSTQSFNLRSSFKNKGSIEKVLNVESDTNEKNYCLQNNKICSRSISEHLEEYLKNQDNKGKRQFGRSLSGTSAVLDKISNFTAKAYRRNILDDGNKITPPATTWRGNVQKLISDFEVNAFGSKNSSGEVTCKPRCQTTARSEPYKKLEDFKKAKSEEDLASERDTEKFWLVHRGGFTAVRALPSSGNHQLDTGKVKVKVESTNEILEVDEDDLEKTNPPQLDKVEDICLLRYINESSVLYLLRQRFGNNLIHTYAAGNLIVTNPQCTLSIYNEKVAALFRGCKSEDMPPHIYALAQTSYRSLLSTRKDQSIVLLGRSGSGKTHNFRHILSYLLHSSGAVNKVLNVEKLNALNTILEAFGNARTCLNNNATRCTNLVSLDFDQTGQIASLSVQMLMLEKQRVAKRPDGEGTFNVFYWLLAGAEGSLAKQLFLDSTTQNTNLFINALYKNEDRQRAVIELSKLNLALKTLGVSEKENFVLWSVIAAIYHLGNAGTVRVATNKWQFADPVHSSRACRLLGTTTEELCQALWSGPASPSRTPSPSDKDRTISGVEALEGFVIGLYSEVVNVVNNLINRCLTTNVHSSMSFVVVDSPGVQNPGSGGQQRGALFTDLCHNYVQERLHLLFHNVNLVAPHDRYTQEHIDVNIEDTFGEFNFPNQLVSMLDKSPPSGVLKTSQTDLREIDRRGLLFLLDEETLYPNSSDETFLERLFQHYGGKDHQMLIRKSGNEHFVIHHLQGTNPIIYNAHGLVKASKENPATRAAVNFLQESTKEEISELFVKGKGGLLSAGAEGSQSLRRVSSIRRTCSVAVKRKSISLQVKFTTDSLIETLRRTRPRFVFCMLPHHNAGNTEIIPGPATGENSLNVPLLRSQLRGYEILPAVRMFKQGFPEYYPHGEFRRRFRLLAPGNAPVPESTNLSSKVQITINGHCPEALDEARAVEEMLMQMDVDVTSYRIGLSQVFFRAGVLAQLESQRDEKLADLIIQLQSRCRGFLARKKLAKLKVQDLAVRCIQRNVRKLMQVREWPWWRLYVQVTPLLNVHRTEEELTAKIHELETLKATLEKLEQERNQLKLENDKLETKLSEMTLDLSEERASGMMQAERLEAETAERVRLEQEVAQIQNEKKNLQQTSERLEMELFYARAEVNGLSESEADFEDGGGDAALYKNKCERAMRELEFTRRRLQQQHEDDLEQLVGLKKQLEKKLADAYEEVEEQRQVAAQWKRKVQKLQSETNDLRLLLEEQSSRNNMLEKKQRKFDSEIQMLQEEVRSERNQKERISREKEMAVAEKYSLEQNLSSVRLELELKEEKVSALSRELEELSRGGGTEQEVTQLRKAKHDLEMKLKDQEEELDELAGQVSMLEGNKLRLEMSLESFRKEHRREMAARDDELDEVRANAQKKIKVLESQLETEHEERTLLVREKHELERRLADAEDRVRHHRAVDEDALQRARRDLKKTKALLRDAQVMLERAKQDSPTKAALRALKNQLEDAELARASAVKAKQSLEAELNEVTGQLEEALRAKGDAENRCQAALREMNSLRIQVDENEEELAELLKKYRQTVQQLSAEQLANQETAGALAEAEAERASLRDQLAEMSARLEANTTVDPMSGLAQKKLEIRIKELESRLELEQTTRGRLEVQITRLKENVERLNEECVQARTKEQAATDLTRKLQRSLRETKEQLAAMQAKDQEAIHKRKELEKRLETAEQEASTARTDLRLAVKRIEDLQSAISGEIGSDSERSASDEEDSGDDSLISHVPSTISSASRASRTPEVTPR